MKEYLISGFSWLESSWQPTYREFTANGVKYVPPVVYERGAVLRFDREGNSKTYQIYGWCEPDENISWTTGNAKLLIPLEEGDSPKTLSLTIYQGIRGGGKLEIWINKHLAFSEIVKEGFQDKIIDLSGIKLQRTTGIQFVSDTFIPSEIMEGSNDKRKLGIGIKTVKLS